MRITVRGGRFGRGRNSNELLFDGEPGSTSRGSALEVGKLHVFLVVDLFGIVSLRPVKIGFNASLSQLR